MNKLLETRVGTVDARLTAQLEDYLDHLCAPMVGRLSYEERMAVRQEVRSHLLLLATGHEELGSAPEAALQAAVRQFGDAGKIGRALLRQRGQPFAPALPFAWSLLHAVIGGIFGAIALMGMDIAVHHQHLTGRVDFFMDCVVGMSLGWIPGLRLKKISTSPLRSALGTGAFYGGFLAGFLTLMGVASPHSRGLQALFLTSVSSVSLLGAVSGVAISRLFRAMRPFEPQSHRLPTLRIE